MKQEISLFLPITVESWGEEISVSLTVSKGEVSDFALGLVLLQQALIDALSIRSPSGQMNLWLQCSLTSRGVGKACAAVGVIDEAKVEVNFNTLAMEFVLTALLKYYRDAMAEVDHIDVEVQPADPGKRPFDLAIRFRDSVPPVSLAEAMRRLED